VILIDKTNQKQNKRGNPDRLKSVKNRVETKRVEIDKTSKKQSQSVPFCA